MFEIGNKVKLVTGGPTMVVNSKPYLLNHWWAKRGEIECVYWKEGKANNYDYAGFGKSSFHPQTLVKVTD